jgi:hypothetical protein
MTEVRMRRTAVATFLLFVLAGPAAWAQTTTSSSSTTAPASSTTTTTAGGAGTGRPPVATLASAADEVTALQGSYCWPQSNGMTSLCADHLFLDPTDALAVSQGETLTLRFQTATSPTTISLQRFDRPNGPTLETLTVPAGNPARFRADLPTGVWILVAFTEWDEGDATYFFKVDVRGARGSVTPASPAKPTRAPPRFTG